LPAILLALICLGTRPPPIGAVRGGSPVVVIDEDDETMEYAPHYVSKRAQKKKKWKSNSTEQAIRVHASNLCKPKID